MLHPAQDRAGCEGDTAFGHHRDEVLDGSGPRLTYEVLRGDTLGGHVA